MWVQGVRDEPPQLHRCFHIHLPPHPAVLRQGRLLPAPSRCRDVPGQIPLASMLPPKTRSAGVQMCRDVLGRTERGLCRHIARAWGPHASVGSTTNPLELGRKDPSWDNPSHPSPQHGQPPHPAEPPCAALGVRGQGVFGARGPQAGRALRFHSRAGFMEQAGFQLGPSQNQPIRYSPISDWALQHPRSRGGGEVAQTHSSCPPQPVSLRNQLWARSGGRTEGGATLI